MLERVLQPGPRAGQASGAEYDDEVPPQRQAITLVQNGAALSVESALLGDPSLPPGKRPELTVDAGALGGVQRALWETQRCLLPCMALQSRDPATMRPLYWHVVGRPVLYLAGIRMVTRVADRMQPWCLLISRPQLGTRSPLPLHLAEMTPRQWLELDGVEAWKHLRLDWLPVDKRVALSFPP